MSVAILIGFYLISLAIAEPPSIELNDGNKIPIVAMGTGFGLDEIFSVEAVRDPVYWGIQAGYRHIDTTGGFLVEDQVAQGIADSIRDGLVTREDLFVTISMGLLRWNEKDHKNQVVPALRESLKELKLDYADLYLLNLPISFMADDPPVDFDYLETWQGMEEARVLGLARSIGVSDFNVSQISRLYDNATIKPAVNEFEVNPTNTQEPLVAHCHELGVVVMASDPLGFLVSRNNETTPPPKCDDPTLVAMGQKYGKTTEQIVLRYLIERGVIPVSKSTKKDRLASNIDIFDFVLTPQEVTTISAFNKNIMVFGTNLL